MRGAIATLQDLGAEVREISLPHTDLALPVDYLIAPAEASANLACYDGIRYGLSDAGESLWETYRRTRGEGSGRRSSAGSCSALMPSARATMTPTT